MGWEEAYKGWDDDGALLLPGILSLMTNAGVIIPFESYVTRDTSGRMEDRGQ